MSLKRSAPSPDQALRTFLMAGAALALPVYGAASAQEDAVTTRHELEAGSLDLDYTAKAGRLAIRDVETGEARGHMFYVAYRVPGEENRPVAFIWNGGPGAPATILHFEIAGPVRVENAALVDNAQSWLSDMDLVFVDPIGTGFSRPAKAEYAAEFYGTLGDIASAAEFVRAWRIENEAVDAPVILAGESWGAVRVASVAHALEERGIAVDGLSLISGGSGLSAGEEAETLIGALRIVNFARTAFHYGLTAPETGDTRGAVEARAEAWVRDTYAPALARIETLTQTERETIAAELAALIGLDPDEIDTATLQITTRAFRERLLDGARLNIFDMRLNTGQDRAPAGVDSAGDEILDYLRYELNYTSTLPYIGLEDWADGYAPGGETPSGPGARWNYATGPVTEAEYQAAIEEAIRRGDGPPRIGPPLPSTADALALNPSMRVLVASGAYDSLANCAGYEELAAQQSDAVRASVTFNCYDGGHMMYRDGPVLEAFSEDMRALARRLN